MASEVEAQQAGGHRRGSRACGLTSVPEGTATTLLPVGGGAPCPASHVGSRGEAWAGPRLGAPGRPPR